ncbi:hypothetical protein ACFY9A_39835, partial [Streptomyces rubradiris]|uniref:hypothetical protein n=1 Tax=Streptomyces rubradiris TaxID=285531 RepID=UPI0036E93A4E
DSIRIELVRRPLPDCDSDDLAGRLEAAARLDRPSPPSMTSTTARWTSSSTPPPRMTAEVNDRVDLGAALFIRGEPRRTTRQNGSTPLE